MTNQPCNEHITVLFIFSCYCSLGIHKKLLNPRKIIAHKLESTQGDKLRVADAPEEDRNFSTGFALKYLVYNITS